MVRIKRTEYQRSYRPTGSMSRGDFLDNVDYAQQRRVLEGSHKQSPFEWDESDTGDAMDSNQFDMNVSNLVSDLSEKVQLVPNKCSPNEKHPAIRKVVSISPGDRKSKSVQVSLSQQKSASKIHHDNQNGRPFSSLTADASSYFRSYKPFVNDLPRVRRPPEHTLRRSSTPHEMSQKSIPEEVEILDGSLKSPEFSPYASGNNTKRISGKRTFNVRADRGVFSTALRASANRQAAKAYRPPSSAPYGSPDSVNRRGVPCSYVDCRCSKNYNF